MGARLGVLVFILLVGAVAFGVTTVVGRLPSGGFETIVGDVTDPTGPVSSDTQTQVFTINPGESAADIGTQLQQRGIVRSSAAFRLVVEQQGVGNKLAAGDYLLSPSMTTEQVVTILASGQVKPGNKVTIPEGWRAEQIADRLDQMDVAPRADFLTAVHQPLTVPGVDVLGSPPPNTLEGYLFPDTYVENNPVSGAAMAGQMVTTFDKQVMSELLSGAAGAPLSPAQVVTLASIVEREARAPEERPVIASVYMNRLKQNMPLQADPTVQYAVATRDGAAASSYQYWKQDLSESDLQIDSPYNTYVHPGLPPGPICNPGEASLQAALRPAQTDYLYFVAKGDGTHLFAKTLAEHNANVEKVQGGQ